MRLEPITLTARGMQIPALVCGPTDAPVVLMLHGFPDHPRSFEPLMRAVAAAGYRGVAPTARGYAPSTLAPDGDYRIEALAGDVVGCLDALEISRAHVLGHDWGAVVAHTVGAMHPERLRSLTTLAVPHLFRLPRALPRVPRQLLRGWYQSFFQIPALSDWAVQRRDWALVRALCRRWSPPSGPEGWSFSDEEWAARVRRFDAPGVRDGMLAYYRQNLSVGRMWALLRGRLRHLETVSVPTLAITGARDGCMDTRLYDHGLDPSDFPAGLRIERVEDAGHFVHLERPAEVTRLLLDWLSRAEHDS